MAREGDKAQLEATPEMIEAGLPSLLRFGVEWLAPRSVIRALLEAALAASPEHQNRSS